VADDRESVEGLPAVSRQLRLPAEHERAERRRRISVVACQQLLHEERIPGGAFEDDGDQFGLGTSSQESLHLLRDLLPRQPSDRDAREAPPVRNRQAREPLRLVVTSSNQNRERLRSRAMREVIEHADGRGVGPVDVIDKQEGRLTGDHGEDRLDEKRRRGLTGSA
jgi:hypothetical protein